MSVLVVGLSHASAPLAVLERAAVTGGALDKLLDDAAAADGVAGAFVLSTCNRVEVYAEVDRFHSGVDGVCELLARHSGTSPGELAGYLYVHYEDRAAQHLLSVACGLHSLAVGEPQILGQVRGALKLARQHGTLSKQLAALGALAARAGRRAHAETAIGSIGRSLVSRGLELAVTQLGPGAAGAESGAGRVADASGAGASALKGVPALVVGAGAASSLAVAALARLGAGPIVVANRTPRRARRLAEAYGSTATGLADLPALLAASDLVVSCTGASAPVLRRADVAAAIRLRRGRAAAAPAARPPTGAEPSAAVRARSSAAAAPSSPGGTPGRPLVLLDLALPRDIEPGAGKLAGVRLIDMDAIAGSGHLADYEPVIAAAREIVAQELATHLGAGRAASVAPTVVALRARASAVVDEELARLDSRLGDLSSKARQEVAKSMSRIADKLLHAPTVRVKELAGSPVADSYEAALRVLFDLEPAAVQAVIRADAGAPPRSGRAPAAPPASGAGTAPGSSAGTAPASTAGPGAAIGEAP